MIAKIDSAEAFAPVYKLQRDLMIVGGLALLVVILTGAWLSRALLGPLRELTAGVTRFAAGDYGAKVAVRTRDEVGAACARHSTAWSTSCATRTSSSSRRTARTRNCC